MPATNLSHLTILSFALSLLPVSPLAVWAGEIVPAQDGTNTNVTIEGNRFQIDGGTLSGDGRNLFQSFQQFGLDANQVANFISNPQIQNILSRVVGGDASVINGLIQVSGGNSHLYLMNPAGIIFGAGASLNVPGDFFATTATGIGLNGTWFNAFGANDYQALVGNPEQFAFDESQVSAIVNSGNLSVGAGRNLTLLGGNVVNTGTISAPEGTIALAAIPGSSTMRISQPGGLLALEIEPPRNGSGQILPFAVRDLPQLLVGAGVETGLQVKADGSVQTLAGRNVSAAPGALTLSGALATSSTTGAGGEIAAIGNRVALLDATLDASGANGGGTMRIGGDYQGRGAIPNAEIVQINRNSSLKADSLGAGDGGRVIVWADKTTQFLGSISARGGILRGDGGFVEVSGLKYLDYRGQVNTLAPFGRAGTLLLDPTDIIVTDSGPFGFTNLDEVDDIDAPNASPSTLDVNLLNNATSNIILQASNDIIFKTDVAIANFGVGLTAEAGNNVTAEGEITTNGGDIVFEARNNITAEGTITTNGGTLFLTALNGAIDIKDVDTSSSFGSGGDIDLYSELRLATGNLNASGATDGGVVILDAGGEINTGAIDASGDNGAGGLIGLLANENISTSWLKAEGGTDGGDIFIWTQGNFRATSTFSAKDGSNASLSTIGDDNNDSIEIQYGSGTPFVVGDATENGTAGAITTGDSILRPVEVFPEGAIEGNIRIGDTQDDDFDRDPPNGDESDAKPPNNDEGNVLKNGGDGNTANNNEGNDAPANNGDDGEDPEGDDDGNDGLLARGDDTDSSDWGDIEDFDEEFDNEFKDYFDFEEEIEVEGTEEALDNLRQVEAITGIKPAILYVVFVPSSPTAKSTSKSSSSQKPSRTDSDRLELVLMSSSGQPIRHKTEVTREQVMKVANEFRTTVTNAKRRNAYLAPAQQLYRWLIAPLETELKANNITNLSFIVESGLRSLPLAALHDGQGFLIERYSVSLLPSIGLSDLRYTDIRNRPVLAMGASTFTNQKPLPEPLPAVPTELDTIANKLWQGDTLLDNQFTLENLQQSRSGKAYSILHLATHGEFKPGKVSDSYIQLWDSQLTLDRLRELRLNDPPVELLVLSACRTALGDEKAELGFAGLAVLAGVKTAVGSLWYVSDEGTLGLMTSFYEQLKDAPIKAEALRKAQLALLKGETFVKNGQLVTPGGTLPLPPALADLKSSNFKHPYFWSAFTMIGSPF